MVLVALVGALIAASDAAIAFCSGVCGSELTFLGAMLPAPPSATGARIAQYAARSAPRSQATSKLPNEAPSTHAHGGAEPLAR